MKKLVLYILFINDMENGNVYVDKVGLEDLITCHDAQFEIIDGY